MKKLHLKKWFKAFYRIIITNFRIAYITHKMIVNQLVTTMCIRVERTK